MRERLLPSGTPAPRKSSNSRAATMFALSAPRDRRGPDRPPAVRRARGRRSRASPPAAPAARRSARAKPAGPRLPGIASRNSSTAATGASMSKALSVAGCSMPKRASGGSMWAREPAADGRGTGLGVGTDASRARPIRARLSSRASPARIAAPPGPMREHRASNSHRPQLALAAGNYGRSHRCPCAPARGLPPRLAT